MFRLKAVYKNLRQTKISQELIYVILLTADFHLNSKKQSINELFDNQRGLISIFIKLFC
jgi:hypothetical protein